MALVDACRTRSADARSVLRVRLRQPLSERAQMLLQQLQIHLQQLQMLLQELSPCSRDPQHRHRRRRRHGG